MPRRLVSANFENAVRVFGHECVQRRLACSSFEIPFSKRLEILRQTPCDPAHHRLRDTRACAFYLFIRQPMGRKSALRREIPWILRGFQGRLSC